MAGPKTESFPAENPSANAILDQDQSGGTVTSAFRDRMRLLREMILRYLTIGKWMLHEVVWLRRSKVFLALGSDVVSFGAQIAAITIALTYARMLQRGNHLEIPRLGISIDPRESIWLLAAATVGVLVTWQLSSLTRYLSDRMALRLSIRFEENCFLRVLSALSDRVPFQEELHGTPMPMSELRKHCTAYVRQTGVASRIILETIIPFFVLCVSFITLLKTGLLLTGLVFGLCLLFLPLIWKINRQSVASSKDFFQNQPQASSEKQAIVNQLISTYAPQARQPEHFASVIQETHIGQADEAFGRRMLVVQRSQMVTSCLMGIGITMVLGVFGFQSLMQGRDWGRLIVYIIALRYCMNNLGRVVSASANLNRLYPSFSSIYFFLKTHRDHQQIDALKTETLKIRAGQNVKFTSDTLSHLPVPPGTRLHLFTGMQMNTIVLPHVLESLFRLNVSELKGLLRETWFTTSDYSLCRMSLREYLQLSEEATLETLTEAWPEEFLETHQSQLETLSLDAQYAEAEWKAFPKALRSAFALTAARNSGAALIGLTSSFLAALEEKTRRVLLGELDKRIVLLFHEDNPIAYNPALIDSAHVIFMAGLSVLAITTVENVQAHAQAWMDLIQVQTDSSSMEGLDTSAEDDMDMNDF